MEALIIGSIILISIILGVIFIVGKETFDDLYFIDLDNYFYTRWIKKLNNLHEKSWIKCNKVLWLILYVYKLDKCGTSKRMKKIIKYAQKINKYRGNDISFEWEIIWFKLYSLRYNKKEYKEYNDRVCRKIKSVYSWEKIQDLISNNLKKGDMLWGD